MDYLTITNMTSSYTLPYPNDFQMKRILNKVGTITTLSGKQISDFNGYKYADTTLQWDTLLDTDLQNLLHALEDWEFSITFSDIDGAHTYNAIPESRVSTKSRFKHNGNIVWKDIQLTVSFPDCYSL